MLAPVSLVFTLFGLIYHARRGDWMWVGAYAVAVGLAVVGMVSQ